MKRRTQWVILAISVLVVVGGVAGTAWFFVHRTDISAFMAPTPTLNPDQENASQAAVVAAELPAHRQAALHPELPDKPQYVPVYPAETTIVLDQTSWVEIGESGSAFAEVTPPGQQVLMHFLRFQSRWYVTGIEAQP